MSAILQHATFSTPLHCPGAHHILSILSKDTCGLADAVPAPAAPVLHPRVFLSESQRQGALAAALASAAAMAASQRGAQPPPPPGGLAGAPGAGPPAHLLQVCYTPHLLCLSTFVGRCLAQAGTLEHCQVCNTKSPRCLPRPVPMTGPGVPSVHPLQVCRRGCLWGARMCACIVAACVPTTRIFFHASKVCMSLYARLLQMWGAAR